QERGLGLSGGGTVIRNGNAYTVLSPDGDSMRAVLNGSHIDVSMGLGRWPSAVRGLLANVNGNVGEIGTRDGRVLSAALTQEGQFLRGTFGFEDLYHPYADSWRIPAAESILSACSRASESGIPAKPFYAQDLDPQVAEHARGICTAAGVKPGPLFEACTLDVAVIGNEGAAKVYVDARQPVAVAVVVTGGGGLRGGGGLGHWLKSCCCLLVLILLLIGSILLALFGRSTDGVLHILKWVVVAAGWLL